MHIFYLHAVFKTKGVGVVVEVHSFLSVGGSLSCVSNSKNLVNAQAEDELQTKSYDTKFPDLCRHVVFPFIFFACIVPGLIF